MVYLLEETRAAQDRKIIGRVEIKRGAVNVAAPLLVCAQACSSLLAPICSSPPLYNDLPDTAILAPETLKVVTLIVLSTPLSLRNCGYVLLETLLTISPFLRRTPTVCEVRSRSRAHSDTRMKYDYSRADHIQAKTGPPLSITSSSFKLFLRLPLMLNAHGADKHVLHAGYIGG